MNDHLSTKDLINGIKHSRHSQKKVSNGNKKHNSMKKVFKIIYYCFITFFILHLMYIGIPLFFNTGPLLSFQNTKIESVAKAGQAASPTLVLTIVEVEDVNFDELDTGEFVIIYNEVDDFYIEKAIIDIDKENKTFSASYAGNTIETYNESSLLGVYVQDANLIQLFQHGISTKQGFIGTALVYIVISSVVYYVAFQRNHHKEEDSE